MKGTGIHIVLFICLSWCGCNKLELNVPQPKKDDTGKTYFDDQNQLVEWSNKSEQVFKHKKIGEFEFNLKHLSADMMALQELRGKVTDEKMLNETRQHYSELMYFKLNIQNPNYHKELLKYNLETGDDYSRRINYFSFEINRDLLLTNGKDTVPCALHEFERTFNLESGLNFVMAFPRIDTKKEYTVIYQDQLFKNGTIKFHFDQTAENLPYFKIK